MRSVVFTGPREVTVREAPTPDPGPGEVLVATTHSAVSPGTELLVYRGEAPDLPADESLPALSGDLSFPVRYGYAAVGEVRATGTRVPEEWVGRRVFGFHPHASHFTADPADLVPVPETPPAAATLLPNVETAVNFLQDGTPRIGERVAVFGQGVVGLLTTALLERCPLGSLVAVDHHDRRRSLAESLGADAAVPPDRAPESVRTLVTESDDAHGRARGPGVGSDADPGVDRDTDPGVDRESGSEADPADPGPASTPDTDPDGSGDPDRSGRERRPADRFAGADLTYELSGNPAALDDALAATAYSGRVVVGSWYGTKRADLQLGGRFHRSRVRVLSSQVSTIDPELRGRWDKSRRLATARARLRDLPVDRLVTHRIPVDRAEEAYELLDRSPEEAVQVLLTY